MKYVKYCDTPMGRIAILEEAEKIIRIDIEKPKQPEEIEKETLLLQKAEKQIMEYFMGKRKNFDLPIHMEGTVFMKAVWQELLKIPYGETQNYQEIAIAIGNPKAVRAVGMANHRNPIPILVPCHRVIGKNGKLTGYALGLDKKEWLLNLEKDNRI